MRRSSSDRAGVYVRQRGGYGAFIPKNLPPDPPIKIDREILTLLSQAERELGRLDGSTEILPNPDLFVFMYVRKEAVLSSQIEGTQASLIDVLEFEAHALKAGRPKDVQEVANYVAAMNYGLDRLKNLPLSLRLIREIHAKLLEGVRGTRRNPGEFRRSQNWIGPSGATLASAIYVPPPPYEMGIALDNLEKFLHDKTFTPFLIKVGIAHAQFETIHPFLDGNGRIGRLLITFLLCQENILKRPLLYLSHYFRLHRDEYYDRLQAIRDTGNWEGWLKFYLRGVSEVSQQATETARRIVQMREDHRQMVTDRMAGGAGKALTLLESLYWMPIVSVKEIVKITSLSFPNANNIAQRFLEMNLLREMTGQKRNRRFIYDPYFNLFPT